jgi:hypothetical protein
MSSRRRRAGGVEQAAEATRWRLIRIGARNALHRNKAAAVTAGVVLLLAAGVAAVRARRKV